MVQWVVFLLVFVVSYTQKTIVQKNLSFQFLNASGNSTAKLTGISLYRSGYAFIAISNQNDTFEDAFVFMFYVRGGNQILNRYIGGKSYKNPLTTQLYQGNDGILVQYEDKNFYPIGLYVTEMSYLIEVNQTLFLSKFGSTFWVLAGVNYYQSPSSPTNFSLTFDESFVILYDIRSQREDYLPSMIWLRFENYHLSIYIISLCFRIFIFILLILFGYFKKEPLYSRSAIPYISCRWILFHNRFCRYISNFYWNFNIYIKL